MAATESLSEDKLPIFEEASAICNSEYPTLARACVSTFAPVLEIELSMDTGKDINEIVQQLKFHSGVARFICGPLMFIRQHAARLRHGLFKSIDRVIIRECILQLGDLLVILDLVKLHQGIDTDECYRIGDAFRHRYGDFFNLNFPGTFVLPKLQPQACLPTPEPAIQDVDGVPVEVSFEWFRDPTNNRRNFLYGKKFQLLNGENKKEWFRFTRFNGKNVILRRKDGTRKYANLCARIRWVVDESW